MFGYIIILPIITIVQKNVLHTGDGYLATRQKWPMLPYLVHKNNCHGNQTFNNYLNLCYVDVFMCGFILLSIDNKVKKSTFF